MVITPTLTTTSVLAVANTRHGPGGHHNPRAKIGDPAHDHLVDGDDARDFLDRHNVSVPDGTPDVESLARLRTVQAPFTFSLPARRRRLEAVRARLPSEHGIGLTPRVGYGPIVKGGQGSLMSSCHHC